MQLQTENVISYAFGEVFCILGEIKSRQKAISNKNVSCSIFYREFT